MADRVGIIFLACCSYYPNRQAVRSETFRLKTIMLRLHMYPSAPPPFFRIPHGVKIRKAYSNSKFPSKQLKFLKLLASSFPVPFPFQIILLRDQPVLQARFPDKPLIQVRIHRAIGKSNADRGCFYSIAPKGNRIFC